MNNGSTYNIDSKIYQFYGYEPSIISVTDVPDDQGHFVRIIWDRSGLDTTGINQPITMYGVWRRLDEELKCDENIKPKNTELRNGEIWESVGTVPAIQNNQYYFVAPTLHDSTEAGLVWSVFQITAHTYDPLIWYASVPDSGYSVDNLAPTAPTGLTAILEINNVALSWYQSYEEDFNYFSIYRGTVSGFPLVDPYAFTIDTTYVDSLVQQGETYYYRVTATDFAGNESDPSDESHIIVSVENTNVTTGLPQSYTLSQNFPNPFNPKTVISYQLPELCEVDLSIYNLSGQKMARLVSKKQSAGTYKIEWDASDFASGMYMYRLQTDKGFIKTKKFVLLK
jgi:hypothetical protein